MRILLLGGTGAMGIALQSILAKKGMEVYITSRKNHKDKEKMHFLLGDAHDNAFMAEILKTGYDAIVDFMIYDSKDFPSRAEQLLNATDQYIFTSSARVYANSVFPITEESPRLLDICTDCNYLKTDEYALAKAREENVLFESECKNWTIIRPYITYNTERLQLGATEKDLWLYRALHGRSIPLPKDVAFRQTTMTYGGDVASAISALIGERKALGEAFNLTSTEHMAWSEVLNIYLEVLEKEIGVIPLIYMPYSSMEFAKVMNNMTQVVYDRLYDRVFDNSKLLSVVGEKLFFKKMKEGLSKCLSDFVKFSQWKENHSWKTEAYIDRNMGEKVQLNEIGKKLEKAEYLGWRYAPDIMEKVYVRHIKRFVIGHVLK